MVIDSKPTWLDEITSYLKMGEYPEDTVEVWRLKIRVTRYTLIDDVLYKRGYSTPLLRYLNEEEVLHVLQEVYEGMCRNHFGGASSGLQNHTSRLFLAYNKTRCPQICEKVSTPCPIIKASPQELSL